MGQVMRCRLAILATLAGLTACAVGPNFKRPAAPADADYGAAPVHGDTLATEGAAGGPQHFVIGGEIPADWWTLYKSAPLTALVEQALKENPDAGAAQAALRQANELYAAQRATLFPSLEGGFSAQRAKNAIGTLANPTSLPQANPYYNLFTAQLSVSYLADVFGGTRRALEAAEAQAASTRFQLEATYLTLSSNVVVTAVQEASLRAQIAATERLLAVQRELTQTVQGQKGLGTASQLDLFSQQAAEGQTLETLPPLNKQLAQTRDALTTLVGQLPAEEPAATFRLEDLTLPEQIPVSIPSQLIEQRPDIRQAEENLHVASAQVGVAIADMLPQFSITAQTGSTALQVSQLFTSYTGFWGAGASLTQTLFDAGALLHRKRAAEAALDQAGAQYRSAVILACQNVADTLHALKADAETLTAAAAVEQAAKGAFEIARQQRTLGTISTVALLNTEQTYQQTVLVVVQARANRYADTAALYQALGGGWWNRPEGSSK
jgi:NodT family efflux transporter outer membrane factor (OMF) lipoprotein